MLHSTTWNGLGYNTTNFEDWMKTVAKGDFLNYIYIFTLRLKYFKILNSGFTVLWGMP